MNKLIYFILIIVALFLSCDDFFEEELDDKTVTLIAPSDALSTSNSSFTFWWDEVDGASKYNLQIVSPDFNGIEKLVLDTNITNTQFEVQLYPGDFEWRVKAFNGASETSFTTYSLKVDSSLNLSGANVLLSSPADFTATKDTNIDFSWEQVYNATDYTIKIRKGSWDNGEGELLDETDNSTTYAYEFIDDGTYIWGVMATNGNFSSQYSKREITIDREVPDVPNQTSPDHGETIMDNSVIFNWTRNSDSGSPILEEIVIGTDSTFNSGIIKEISGLDLTHTENFSVPEGSSEKYYWKIRSIDAAGNESAFTDFRRFTVKNEK